MQFIKHFIICSWSPFATAALISFFLCMPVSSCLHCSLSRLVSFSFALGKYTCKRWTISVLSHIDKVGRRKKNKKGKTFFFENRIAPSYMHVTLIVGTCVLVIFYSFQWFKLKISTLKIFLCGIMIWSNCFITHISLGYSLV